MSQYKFYSFASFWIHDLRIMAAGIISDLNLIKDGAKRRQNSSIVNNHLSFQKGAGWPD